MKIIPHIEFNKYEIHNLLKIENDNTTIFTNNELKMIDDYIKELEAYKYNLDRDYLRLEKENKKLKEVYEKAIKLIEDTYYSKNTTNIDSIVLSSDKLIKVREILKEVE